MGARVRFVADLMGFGGAAGTSPTANQSRREATFAKLETGRIVGGPRLHVCRVSFFSCVSYCATRRAARRWRGVRGARYAIFPLITTTPSQPRRTLPLVSIRPLARKVYQPVVEVRTKYFANKTFGRRIVLWRWASASRSSRACG